MHCYKLISSVFVTVVLLFSLCCTALADSADATPVPLQPAPEGAELSPAAEADGEGILVTVPMPARMRAEQVRVRIRTGEDNGTLLFDGRRSPKGDAVFLFLGGDREQTDCFVRIYVEGRLYQEYQLDWSASSHRLHRDRSAEVDFRV